MPISNEANTGHPAKTRVALLVARPLRSLIDAPLRGVCRAARFTSSCQPINFTSTSTHSLPTIQDNKCYARHLALAVVDLSIWTNDSTTLYHKLSQARFWDHRGSTLRLPLLKTRSKSGGNGERWGVDNILAIDSIEYIGEIHHSDCDISEHYFRKLWDNWVYHPVWWNCHAFALRLCYLLLDNPATQSSLASLAQWLHLETVRQIHDLESRGHHLTGVLLAAAANPIYVLIPIPNSLSKISAKLDKAQMKNWQANMDRLDERIPALKEFHAMQRAAIGELAEIIATRRHKIPLLTFFSRSGWKWALLGRVQDSPLKDVMATARQSRYLQ
ncbi:hypothetical protein B0T16DRAFT_390062 [Cercophora newfieldiana]|uniref:Uncharacterized protein n=1 Tax=Cercophora newfieldiana TaxID=92897 RepID=A0AA39Y3W2_9PEZI|nr:hypothetical protein B0T16DRAFT_390062 [Cercophora newfieldiana]